MLVLLAIKQGSCGFVGENDALVTSAKQQHKFRSMHGKPIMKSADKFINEGYHVEVLQNPDEGEIKTLVDNNQKAYYALADIAKRTKRTIIPTIQPRDIEESLGIMVINVQKATCMRFDTIENSVYPLDDQLNLQRENRIKVFNAEGIVNEDLLNLFQSI